MMIDCVVDVYVCRYQQLANLQIQRRMIEGFTETRRQILQLKSNNRQNWLAYCFGCHLSKNVRFMHMCDIHSCTLEG